MLRRIGQALGWLGWGILAVLGLGLVLLYLLLQSGPGHEFFLRTALSQADERLGGDLEVQGIRSDGLLRGFTLHGVAIRDQAGRPFVEADSLQIGYSVRDLVRRRLILRPTRVWAPRVVLETLHGDDRSNLDRIFRPLPADAEGRPLPPDAEGPGEPSSFLLVIRGLEILEGSFVLRLPLVGDRPEQGLVEEAPEGIYRVFRFSGIDALVQEARILDPRQEGERFLFRRLSLEAHLVDEALQVADFRGEVRRHGSRVEVEAERLWLPASELAGRLAVDWGDPDALPFLDVDLSADPVRLADFHWILPELPDGEGRFDVTSQGPADSGRWRFRSADIVVGESRVQGDFGLDLGDGVRLVETDLELMPLWLATLDPWLPEPLPVQGRLRGRVRADGSLGRLQVGGSLTLDDPERDIPSSVFDFDGVLHLEGSPGVTEFQVDAPELRYPTLLAFFPDQRVDGTGSLSGTASGRLDEGIRLEARMEHRLENEASRSRIGVRGTVRSLGEELELDLVGVLEPLSFAGISGGLDRPFPLRGEVSGEVRVQGPLGDLVVAGDLLTPAGPLAGEARFDARNPARRYRLDVSVEDFALGEFLVDLPDPTTVTGSVLLDASGFDLREVEGTARISLDRSRIGGLTVEEGRVAMEAREGVLTLEGLEFRSSLVQVSGGGDLGLREGAPGGELVLEWEVGSLEGLRPFIEPGVAIDLEGLTELDREVLRVQGIDPDTLSAPMPLGGEASGTIRITGGLPQLRGEGFVELSEGLFGATSLAAGRADFVARWIDEEGWDAEVTLELDRFVHEDYSVLRAEGEAAYTPGRGMTRFHIQRDERESYRVRGSVSHDALGGDVELDSLAMELDGEVWALDEPARILFRDSRVSTELIRFSRAAGEGGEGEGIPFVVEARGTFDREGTSDFRLDLQGVDLDRIARMTHMERIPSGILSMDLAFRGAPDNPSMEGTFQVGGFAFNGTALSMVEGTLSHGDHLLRATVHADHEGERRLEGRGALPLDLSLHAVEERLPDGEVEADVEVNQFPAAAALAFLDAIEGVQGTLDGRIRVGGTVRAPRPTGELRLRNGAMTIPDVGLRTTDIRADLVLRDDRTVEVDAEARARGTGRVAGTLSLEDPTDPGFDLRIDLSGFQAVDRRDLNARIGGALTLGGSYRQPQIGGAMRVEQGVLFLEEFTRAAQVVDLTDPAFRDVVDTTLVAGGGAVDTTENPFLEGLLVEVDLTLQRDFWLRSREMNVEIAGDLIVTFDRRRRELLLVGTLEAVRGTYVAFGRTFQVREGTVDFPGTPGINPALSIQAANRLRQPEGEPLNVIANLEGTLERPRVSLTSDAEPPIVESDLISYLLFGRPSYALASGEMSVLEGVESAGIQLGIGTVASQLGAVVARELGVDYFAVTQAQQAPGAERGGLGGVFADTQIEMGQYLSENVFLAVMLRPLTGLGGSTHNQIPGARVEWRFSDHWTTEAFVEDRFARQGVSGFGELGFTLSKVFGFALYRQWSY
jgi:hypothetical protein